MKFFEETKKRHFGRRLWDRIVALWPFVTKRFHESQIEAQKSAAYHRAALQQKSFDTELEVRTQRVRSIIERLSQLEWSRLPDSQRYSLRIDLDPRLMCYGSMVRDDLKIIAEHFGRQVQYEIESSKFVHSANETRRNERFPRMPVGSFDERCPTTRP